MEKKNSVNILLVVLIVFLTLIVGLLGGYLIIDNFINKDVDINEGTGGSDNNQNNQIISDTVKINTGENTYDLKLLQKIDTTNSYAYVFLENDSKGLDLYELHKNSPSTKLFSCSSGCSVSEVQIVGKKLYFNLWYYDKKLSNNLVSIDLETSSFDNIFATSDLLTVNYAVTEDYLFVGQIGRDLGATKPEYYLKRYNIKTGTVDSFLEDKNMRWSNILYFDNMIYISAYVYDENAPYENDSGEILGYGFDVLKYYTMQLDDSNLKEVSEADYNKAFNSVNYIEPVADYDGFSVIHNNKGLSLTRIPNGTLNVYFNDDKIFTTNGHIEFYFKHHINNYNEILFMDCNGFDACVTEEYYIYNFETKKFKTIEPQEYEYSTVIYLK